jgi:hypothetical protein
VGAGELGGMVSCSKVSPEKCNNKEGTDRLLHRRWKDKSIRRKQAVNGDLDVET